MTYTQMKYKVFDALNSENIDEEDVIILYNADKGWFHCIIEDLEGSLSKPARELVKKIYSRFECEVNYL